MFEVYDISDLRGSKIIKTFGTYDEARQYLAFHVDSFKGGMYSILNKETGDFEQFHRTFHDLVQFGSGNINN